MTNDSTYPFWQGTKIMKSNDHNSETLALQKRIGELNAIIILRDDQMRELQQQLAAARAQIPCSLCDGTGHRKSAQATCCFCDGTGWKYPVARTEQGKTTQ